MKAEKFQKKDAMICSKMFYLDTKDYKKLNWWLEINRKNGFKKIVLYNNSIPNTKDFNNLFLKYQDFIEIKPMHYFPDIFQNSQKFVEKMQDLYKPWQNIFEINVFEILLFNECYLDNIDKYKYIAIYDIDEMILARDLMIYDNNNVNLLKKFQANYEFQINIINPINEYMNNLIKDFVKNDLKNLYFKNAFYIDYKIISNLFENFQKSKSISRFFKEYFIQIQLDTKNNNIYENLTFKISTQEENNYLFSLYNLYTNFLVPFLGQNEIPEYFDRFFYLASSANAGGKPIYQTKIYYMIDSHHFPKNMFEIPYNCGHSSHFRKIGRFDQNTIAISTLHFDMNYLSNYFINHSADAIAEFKSLIKIKEIQT